MDSLRSSTRRDFCKTAAALSAGLAHSPVRLFAQETPTPRFKLIGFTKPFQNLSFDETSDTVAEVGWDGIECPVRPKGQIEPERAADELPKLVEALRKRGKELTVLTTSITNPTQPHAEPLLRAAAKLGIRRYRLGWWQYRPGKSIPDQVRNIASELRELSALNKELGLQAGLQNHSGPDYVGAPIWDVWSMIKDLDPKTMGFCFDIAHATIEGGLSWPTQARLVEPYLTAVFVKDFIWEKPQPGSQPKWVMLGDGMVNKAFFTWLKTTAFAGPISQHHEYDHGEGKPMVARMQKDLKVLREWLASAA